MSEFKVGDLVYLPALGAAVYQVKENGVFDPMFYPLKAVDGNDAVVIFAKNGRTRVGDGLPGVFHATPENHESLEKLYGIEFEKPPVKPTSREIVRAMLERGDKYVCCWLSDDVETPDKSSVCDFVVKLNNDPKYLYKATWHIWKYATPFDPRTGEAITELPE